MLWLRQMGIALISFLIAGFMFGVAGSAATTIGLVVALPDPLGPAVGVLTIVAALFLAHRIYVELERRDAIRSGRMARP
jgi:hypothetical protein